MQVLFRRERVKQLFWYKSRAIPHLPRMKTIFICEWFFVAFVFNWRIFMAYTGWAFISLTLLHPTPYLMFRRIFSKNTKPAHAQHSCTTFRSFVNNNISWLPCRPPIYWTSTTARHVSLGSSVVGVSHKSSGFCGFDPSGAQNRFCK